MSQLPGKGLGGALEIRGAAAVVAGAQIERPGGCSENSWLCKYKYGVETCGSMWARAGFAESTRPQREKAGYKYK
jgi:hypothetical protein